MSCTAAVRPFPISIHAPARGATNSVYISNLYPLDFNPRSCERSDLVSRPDWIIDPISIHAPARGATDIAESLGVTVEISIHAPARGATRISRRSILGIWIFQSTLLREERHPFFVLIPTSFIFQSTLLREERLTSIPSTILIFLFQSTLLREERLPAAMTILRFRRFQSTLLREERQFALQ